MSLGLESTLTRMARFQQRWREQPTCEVCRQRPSGIVSSVRGALRAACRSCAGSRETRIADSSREARGRSLVGREDQSIDYLERDLRLSAIEHDATYGTNLAARHVSGGDELSCLEASLRTAERQHDTTHGTNLGLLAARRHLCLLEDDCQRWLQ